MTTVAVETFYVRDGPGDWHIEGPSVERMLCDVEIGMDGGEVRTKRPTRVCAECDARCKSCEENAESEVSES